MGKLIVMEGACDGIGKTTQFNLLKDSLVKDGYEVSSHHFPSYGTAQGKLAEEYLKGNYGQPNELSPYLVNSFYAIDRGITWFSSLKKMYEENKIILLDRYTTSSLIYQSANFNNDDDKKKFIEYVTDYEYNKLGIKEPDLVIYLHAPFDLVTKLREARKSNEGIIKDIHESNLLFMKKVYDNSLFVSSYLNFERVECATNGKMDSIEDIHNKVNKIVKRRLSK